MSNTKYKLILGSASPRRQQLLKEAGYNFEIRVGNTPEDYPLDLKNEDIPVYLAELKANHLRKDLNEEELLVTADTVVVLDKQVIGKPGNREEAIEMLSALSGKKHVVITGVCLATKDKQLTFSVETAVYFSFLELKDIIYYVDHYHHFDKAGAYGIQEWIGYIGIERIDGSFYNVMGLPIQQLYHRLKEFELFNY